MSAGRNRNRNRANFNNFRRIPIRRVKQPTAWIAWITGITGVVTLALLLLGFGVALSADDWGQIPYGAIYTSPSELISLSAVAVSRLVARFGSMDFTYQVIADSVSTAWLSAICMAALLLMITWPGAPMVGLCRRKYRQAAEGLRRHFTRPTRSKAVFNAFFAALGVLIVFPFTAVAYLWLIIIASCVLAIFPLIGHTAGKLYIQEEVVGPEYCQSDPRVRNHRGAICLTVSTKDLGVWRGRLVYSTGSVIVLYDKEKPGQSKIVRIPLADAIVEANHFK